ncbi:vitamin K epoxide reductase complex subunit 1-like protein 1 isoform X2 [Anabrus simplex]|uniref:vitamin K epoxide reductase complex subunit 1-like protein 1 isoform X2 n=1 Tax=Anabrus simplex TaxID=316456 RepID=UPI0034DDC4C5
MLSLSESRKEHDKEYTAMCDISENMSCSKAFMSPYGKGFGILGRIFGEESIVNQPNSISGIIFYCILACLGTINTVPATRWLVGLCILSNVASLYLAYILYFILYDFCVVCVSTYVVNAINFVLSVMKLREVKNLEGKNQDGATNKKMK